MAASKANNTSVDWGDVPGWITALAALGTLIIAGIAAKAALSQASEARALRVEQAAPYVIVDTEMSTASSMYMELYVKNVGQTVARNVHVTFDPPLRSNMDAREYKRAQAGFLRRPIPVLPPGREHRMLFESGPDLYGSDLPRIYEATVTFDGVGGPHTLTYTLDLDVYFGHESFNTYGVHDVARNLKDMLHEIKKWQTPGRTRGLLVHTLDERDERRRDREHYEARMQERRQAEAAASTEEAEPG